MKFPGQDRFPSWGRITMEASSQSDPKGKAVLNVWTYLTQLNTREVFDRPRRLTAVQYFNFCSKQGTMVVAHIISDWLK